MGNKKKKKWFDILFYVLVIVGVVYIIGVLSYPTAVKVINQNERHKQLVALIKQEKWEEAIKIASSISTEQDFLDFYVTSKTKFNNNTSKDFTEEDITKIKEILDIIPKTYSGEFKEDIIKFKEIVDSKYQPYAKIKKEREDKIKGETYFYELRNKDPHVGMSSDELIFSKWGEPKKINKTTNTYGISEQWVYGNGRYVYLDDGIVTSIQE